MIHNVITWFELSVKDLNKAKQFYEKVLDTTLSKMEMGGYTSLTFPFDGTQVSGALVQSDQHEANLAATLYFNAGEVLQPVLDRVEENGGKIVMGATPIQSGVIAQVLDSEGNKIGLFALSA